MAREVDDHFQFPGRNYTVVVADKTICWILTGLILTVAAGGDIDKMDYLLYYGLKGVRLIYEHPKCSRILLNHRSELEIL